MQSLELKIPPPVIAALCAGLHALSVWIWPVKWGQAPIWLVLGVLALAGVFGLGGLWGCWRCQTTVHPWNPEETRVLVTTGVFGWSRNPMYVALLCVLLAWVVSPVHPLSALWMMLAFLWLHYFQVRPEERILAAKFGEAYRQYAHKVRPWV